jgi:sugar phosphate isomerase/epimerase
MLTRRALLNSLPAAAAAAPGPRLKIGVMDGIAGYGSDPRAVQAAAELGFQGLQVTLGRKSPGGPLLLSDPALHASFVSESRRLHVPLVSTYLDLLHVHCLKRDPAAVRLASEGIAVTGRLGAPILMLVFFGPCALESRADMDAVVGPLKELAREAEKAKLTLGFENTIRAEDDLRILDAVASNALKIYYDIGNATNLYSVDPQAEIRHLGRDRICQFHFKDKGYLGEGRVDVPGALRAIAATGWQGYIVLETSSPSKDRPADLRRNLAYLRGLL